MLLILHFLLSLQNANIFCLLGCSMSMLRNAGTYHIFVSRTGWVVLSIPWLHTAAPSTRWKTASQWPFHGIHPSTSHLPMSILHSNQHSLWRCHQLRQWLLLWAKQHLLVWPVHQRRTKLRSILWRRVWTLPSDLTDLSRKRSAKLERSWWKPFMQASKLDYR